MFKIINCVQISAIKAHSHCVKVEAKTKNIFSLFFSFLMFLAFASTFALCE